MEIDSSKRIKDISVLTLGELLIGFKTRKAIEIDTTELKIEFHSRVKNQLYQYCQRLCFRNRYDTSVAKDIFQETLIKALSNIEKFEFDYSLPEERVRNKFFVWLNKIARNLYLDFLKERAKIYYSENISEEFENEECLEDSFEIEENESTDVILQEAWDDLDDRERLIFYYCIKYDCLDNNDHLPDDVIDELCDILNVQKENIRKIKSRALKRLRSKFQRKT